MGNKQTSQEQQYARLTSRGAILTQLYRLQDLGLNDPSDPRRATRGTITNGLGAIGMMPPADLECSSLRWLEGAGYVEVDWGLDDQTTYESAAITQKGIDLYESKDAKRREPGLMLQPRR